jgi:hypothetical protein
LLDRIGEDELTGRELFVVDVEHAQDLPAEFPLRSKHFACLIAWDASTVSVAIIAQVARKLLDAGAVYICAWGSGCERLHDIFDEEIVGSDPPATLPPIMTTWHTDEPLDDVIWFLLRTAWPDDVYAETCLSSLGIAIGSACYATAMRVAFADPRAFADGERC